MKPRNSHQQIAVLFGVLGHPARLRILDELRRREACVCHLQSVLDQRQPYVSQQLRALRDAGLVECRREGLYTYYYLCDPQVIEVLEAVLGPIGEPGHPGGCTCPECRAEGSRLM